MNHYILFLVILISAYMSVLLACYTDLIAGTKKAKIRNERVSSHKWDRTNTKIIRYFCRLIVFLIPDIIYLALSVITGDYHYFSFHVPEIPIFTMIAAISCVSTEVISIYEPANLKEKQELEKQREIIKHLWTLHRNHTL